MSRPRKALRRFFSCRTPGALRRLRAAGEEGFTLIELVITLVILPLIIGAIAVALFVTFSEQAGVSTRVATSADAQVTSAYFVRDVQSAMYVTTTRTPSAAAWPSTAGVTSDCGSGTTLIVSLAWPSGQQPIHDGATVVSYWRMAHNVLERDLCKGSATPSSSITSRDYVLPLTHILLSCVTAGCGASAAQTWISAQTVSGVTLPATESLTKGKYGTTRKYDYSLTAAPRASSTGGAYALGRPSHIPPCTPRTNKSTCPVPPLLALGAGLGVVTESSSGKHKTVIHVVTGNAVLNTGYFRMTTGTTFTAPSITVMKTACNATTYKQAPAPPKCTGTICATNVHKCAPPTPAPTVWSPMTKATPDPFATLPDPTPAALGLTIHTTCQPHTGKLTPGEYECGDLATTLTFSGGTTTVTLANGIYIFDTGLKVLGGAALHGTTVLIYLPCRHGTADQWVPSNTRAYHCLEGFQVTSSTINVRPLGTPPYSNLWFWQNSGDTNTVKVSGQGAISVTGGALYAPGAEVDLSGLGTGHTTVGAIVASTFRVANSKVTVRGFSP